MKLWWWTTGVLAAVEAAALAWMYFRLRAISALDTRVDRLSGALTLLTDTTEAGLAAVAAEMARPGSRRAPAVSPRRATAKRLASAVRRGDDVAAIASREGVSESEVRLHLAMVTAGAGAAPVDADLAAPRVRPRAVAHDGIPEINHREASHAAMRA